METIFTPKPHYETESWKSLKEMSNIFLSKQMVEEFLNYTKGQLKKHANSKLVGKRKYHIVRLLLEVKRVIAGQQPVIYWDENKGNILI
jgi:hypothetical protein